MTVAAFDFRSPPPGELERQAAAWIQAATGRASASWPAMLGYSAELRFDAIETMTFRSAVSRLPAGTLAFPLTTTDAADDTALLALSRPLMLALLAGLLGEVPTEIPADREPTELEASLNDYLVRDLFLVHLESTWTGDGNLQLAAGRLGIPAAIRRGASGDMALLASLMVVTSFGEFPVFLLLPRVGRWEHLAAPPRPPARSGSANPDQMAALVSEMPVELDVVLGSAEVTMSAVAHLRRRSHSASAKNQRAPRRLRRRRQEISGVARRDRPPGRNSDSYPGRRLNS